MKDRIQKILEELGITATRLADEIQVQRSGISHILSGRNQPSYDFLTRLLSRYPEIDARWLLTGKGEIYTHSQSIPHHESALNEPLNMVKSEDPAPYNVTNVNHINKIILLHPDGTFEVYTPGKSH